MFNFPTIDMVKTGQNIMRLKIQNGFSVKDLQDVFGFAGVTGDFGTGNNNNLT